MIEKDVGVLQAEVVALQAVLMSVFRQMVKRNPDLAPTFCEAFDEAETILTGVAEKLGVEAPLDTMVGALRVIEELRKAVITDESSCS